MLWDVCCIVISLYKNDHLQEAVGRSVLDVAQKFTAGTCGLEEVMQEQEEGHVLVIDGGGGSAS